MFFKRKEIYSQIQEYVLWKGQFCYTSENQKIILESLAKRLKIDDIRDLTEENLLEYQKHLHDVTYSNAVLLNTYKTIRCFLRYYRSRGYDCINPKIIGDYGINKTIHSGRTMSVIHT